MSLKVVFNLKTVGMPVEQSDCCCGHGLKDVEDLTECPSCGGYMCVHIECDCPCDVLEEEFED